MEKVEQTYKLPEGWENARIQDISVPSTKTNKSKTDITGDFYYIDVNSIDNNSFSIVNPQKYNWNTAPSRAQQIIKTNNILIATVRPYLRNIAIVNEKYNKQVCSSAFCVIHPIIVNAKYVYYYVLSNQFILSINKLAKGTSYPAVTNQIVLNQTIPLAPLLEQHRIVSKIETLFSELEHAEKNLHETKKQLETYRQSLLKKAFNGELSEKWRDENLEELKKSENKLPANWKYKKLASLSDFVGSGSTPRGGRNIYIEDGIPFIRSQNVLVNRLIEDDLVFISSEINEKMKRTHTKPKDVLLNITGASIGRCAYIHEGFSEGNVNQHVCIIRANHKMIDYKYLTFFLNSPEAQLRIKQINTGATREALTLSQIKAFEIPVCDMREQNVITQTLESQFTLIDNLNDTINKSIEEVVSLRHSILKKAFDGKLVNQEPTDEPVRKLLELIKKEKIEYLKDQKETLLQKPKRILQMDSNKTVWQILSSSKIAIRTDKLWSESKHKDDIDAFYAEVKELIDSGKIVEDKRQGKVSYLKVK